jgi:hypothetical protein
MGWPQEMPALERFSVHGDGLVSMRVNQPGGRVVPFWRSGLSSSGTFHWAGQVDAQGNPIQGFGIMTNIN